MTSRRNCDVVWNSTLLFQKIMIVQILMIAIVDNNDKDDTEIGDYDDLWDV